MQTLPFTTDVAPAPRRLALFQAGAVDYRVDAIGDPLDFSVAWRLLVLGEVNIVESLVTPVRYSRTPAMIEEDGKDRISVLYLMTGKTTGTIDDKAVAISPGDALIFDLVQPMDVASDGSTRYRIVTMPRHLVAEILPTPHFSGVIPASPALKLAFDQVAYLLDHAAEVPDESAMFHARAIRNLLAMAMLPAYRSTRLEDDSAPLLRRACDVIDRDLRAHHDAATLAMAVAEPVSAVAAVIERFGGIGVLVERRRLLEAYRRLCDPSQGAPISTIALQCGFASPTVFGRRFRAVFQCSPRDVRAQQGGQLPTWAGAYRVEDNYGPLRLG